MLLGRPAEGLGGRPSLRLTDRATNGLESETAALRVLGKAGLNWFVKQGEMSMIAGWMVGSVGKAICRFGGEWGAEKGGAGRTSIPHCFDYLLDIEVYACMYSTYYCAHTSSVCLSIQVFKGESKQTPFELRNVSEFAQTWLG